MWIMLQRYTDEGIMHKCFSYSSVVLVLCIYMYIIWCNVLRLLNMKMKASKHSLYVNCCMFIWPCLCNKLRIINFMLFFTLNLLTQQQILYAYKTFIGEYTYIRKCCILGYINVNFYSFCLDFNKIKNIMIQNIEFLKYFIECNKLIYPLESRYSVLGMGIILFIKRWCKMSSYFD